MFRRLLKYRAELNPVMQQQNTHFPTTRMPISATLNMSISHPLGDSTNMKKNMILNGGSRLATNHYKTIHDAMDEDNNDLRESDFASHDYDE